MSRPALGLIETAGLTGAIQATHAATKAGEVAIASAERTSAGHIVVKIEGEWAVVQEAVEAGARAADAAGELISMHVIPRTDNGVLDFLPYRQFVARYLPEGSEAPRRTAVKERPKPKPARPKRSPKTPPPAQPKAEVKPDPAPPPTPVPVEPPQAEPARVEPQAAETPPAPAVQPVPPAPPGDTSVGEPSLEDLSKLPVVKLRRYARDVKGLPIQGRQISMANKSQLLDAIRAARGES